MREDWIYGFAVGFMTGSLFFNNLYLRLLCFGIAWELLILEYELKSTIKQEKTE